MTVLKLPAPGVRAGRNEVKQMTDEQREKVIEMLILFIERACKGGTDAEIAAMPDAVKELRLLTYDPA